MPTSTKQLDRLTLRELIVYGNKLINEFWATKSTDEQELEALVSGIGQVIEKERDRVGRMLSAELK